jgi:hypothetical protein
LLEPFYKGPSNTVFVVRATKDNTRQDELPVKAGYLGLVFINDPFVWFDPISGEGVVASEETIGGFWEKFPKYNKNLQTLFSDVKSHAEKYPKTDHQAYLERTGKGYGFEEASPEIEIDDPDYGF